MLNRLVLILQTVRHCGGDGAKYTAILVAALLIVTTGAAYGDSQRGVVQYQSPNSVLILGDEDLENHASTGAGTEDNPFVIAGLDFHMGTYWEPLGVDVSFAIVNTTRNLIVSEARFDPAPSPLLNTFFVIWNCTNVKVVESDLGGYSNIQMTLLIKNSSDISISENILQNWAEASVLIENSSDVLVERNAVRGGSKGPGILVRSSSSVQIRENYIGGCAIGVKLNDSTDVEVSGCLMERNSLDFQDDNTEGTNSYSEGKLVFLWSDTKTHLTAIVILVEAIMLLVAVWVIRSEDRKNTRTVGNQAKNHTDGGPGDEKHV